MVIAGAELVRDGDDYPSATVLGTAERSIDLFSVLNTAIQLKPLVFIGK